MSRFTVELLRDPELLRIADTAYAEVRREAEIRGGRITIETVAERIAELTEWRRRALRAEARLGPPDIPRATIAVSDTPPKERP